MGYKKLICIVLFLCFTFVYGCSSSNETSLEDYPQYIPEDNSYCLTAPEGFVIDNEDIDGFIYIYSDEKAIPYIMFRQYEYEGTITAFEKEYMLLLANDFADCQYTLNKHMNNNIGGKKVVYLDSTYVIDEYTVRDVRCIFQQGSSVYVFTKKEVPALQHNVTNEFDWVINNFVVYEN